jgi:hypothetical protein
MPWSSPTRTSLSFSGPTGVFILALDWSYLKEDLGVLYDDINYSFIGSLFFYPVRVLQPAFSFLVELY